jgi:hypothetical protein
MNLGVFRFRSISYFKMPHLKAMAGGTLPLPFPLLIDEKGREYPRPPAPGTGAGAATGSPGGCDACPCAEGTVDPRSAAAATWWAAPAEKMGEDKSRDKQGGQI